MTTTVEQLGESTIVDVPPAARITFKLVAVSTDDSIKRLYVDLLLEGSHDNADGPSHEYSVGPVSSENVFPHIIGMVTDLVRHTTDLVCLFNFKQEFGDMFTITSEPDNNSSN